MANFKVLFGKLSPGQQAEVMHRVAKDQAVIDAKKSRASLSPALGSAVRKLRTGAKLNQQELAERLGIKQPVVARMERQSDMKLSTLYALVEAVGGKLEIVAKMPGGRGRRVSRVFLAGGKASN